MKLLIYSHYFAPSIGGVEAVVLSLARGLSELRDSRGASEFEVTVVTQTPAENYDDSALPFRVVRQPGPFQLWRHLGEAGKVLLAGPAILPLLFGLLRRKNAIVTHHGYQSICPNGMLFQFSPQTNCPGHFAAGKYGECLRCNASQEGWARSLKLLLVTFVRRALARRAAANVGVSEHVCKRIVLPQLLVIRNAAIPSGDLAISADSAQLSDPRIRFVYVGRLVTEKGVRILLEAAWLLAQQNLRPPILIIGDGPERASLERQKDLLKMGENVVFLGFRRGRALEEQIGRLSVLVMPSLCEDVAPLSVLDMMMRGRLIICSKIGGLAEQVGEAGLTFTPGDARELAERMAEVLHNTVLIERLGKCARDRAVSYYSLPRMIGQYADLLRSRI